MQSSHSLSFKVVLLGEGRVGKTSLISRYVNDMFDSDQKSTTQANMYCSKIVPIDETIVNGGGARASTMGPSLTTVQLSLWDTAGQERYHALAPTYYRNADAAMLVYDVCDRDSMERVRTWVVELRAVVGDRIELALCGNKCDQPAGDQEVTLEEGTKLAAELGATLHFRTSAKTGENVAEAFSAVASSLAREQLQWQRQQQEQRGGAPFRGRRPGLLRIIDGDGSVSPVPFDSEGTKEQRTMADYDDAVTEPRRGRSRRTVTLDAPPLPATGDPAPAAGGGVGSGGCC